MYTKNKILLPFLFYFMLGYQGLCQTINKPEVKKNVVFIELGGPGGLGSINYEYLFRTMSKLKFSVCLGVSTYQLDDFRNDFNPDIIIPASIHAYYGNNHHLEISLGQTFTSIVLAGTSDYNPERKSSLSAHATIGYRYKKKDKAMVYKIAYSPIIENNTTFRHWFLFALGFAF